MTILYIIYDFLFVQHLGTWQNLTLIIFLILIY